MLDSGFSLKESVSNTGENTGEVISLFLADSESVGDDELGERGGFDTKVLEFGEVESGGEGVTPFWEEGLGDRPNENKDMCFLPGAFEAAGDDEDRTASVELSCWLWKKVMTEDKIGRKV